MNGRLMLYIDQWGNHWWARTVKELQKQLGGHVSKMYMDFKDGTTAHTGYVVGKHWCTAYAPYKGSA